MAQSFNVNLAIQIPDDMVVMEKTEYEALKNNETEGNWVGMKVLVKRTGRSDTWLKNNVLNNVMLKDRLDIEKGGWVFYPAKGDHWLFKLSGMKDFIENEFSHHIGGKK